MRKYRIFQVDSFIKVLALSAILTLTIGCENTNSKKNIGQSSESTKENIENNIDEETQESTEQNIQEDIQEDTQELMVFIINYENDSILYKTLEWVDVPSERATELGITEVDAPNGFYIYDGESLMETKEISSECSITVLDWTVADGGTYESKELSIDSFDEVLNDRLSVNEYIPYEITLENDLIVEIQERYVP